MPVRFDASKTAALGGVRKSPAPGTGSRTFARFASEPAPRQSAVFIRDDGCRTGTCSFRHLPPNDVPEEFTVSRGNGLNGRDGIPAIKYTFGLCVALSLAVPANRPHIPGFNSLIAENSVHLPIYPYNIIKPNDWRRVA